MTTFLIVVSSLVVGALIGLPITLMGLETLFNGNFVFGFFTTYVGGVILYCCLRFTTESVFKS